MIIGGVVGGVVGLVLSILVYVNYAEWYCEWICVPYFQGFARQTNLLLCFSPCVFPIVGGIVGPIIGVWGNRLTAFNRGANIRITIVIGLLILAALACGNSDEAVPTLKATAVPPAPLNQTVDYGDQDQPNLVFDEPSYEDAVA